MSPKITCSILCYNYGRFLNQAIDSCLNQTIDRELFEVLVIDDGSTDNTPEICAMYGDRIRVSRTANQGFSQSLARGLEEAKGEYVAYLDADDWWAPNKLETILPALDSNNLVVMHLLTKVNEEGVVGEHVGFGGHTSSVCVHKQAGLTLLPATTEIFCRPLLDAGKGVFINQALGYYRIHDKAMTDRSPNGAHTAFFAKTSHVTAGRLFELEKHPPFWGDKKQMAKLAKWYRAEGYIKDFERVTETRDSGKYLPYWLRMIKAMVNSRRPISKRELRLTGRALRQILSK